MKFVNFFTKQKDKTPRRKRVVADYYQDSVNQYGKQQIKSLLDRGLNVQF